MFQKTPVIAIEEHYWDPVLEAYFPPGGGRDENLLKRLHDVGELRLREMDESGIDVQVLSHGGPSGQILNPDIAVDVSRRVNDRLAATIAHHPTRFAAFAVLPTILPDASANELERCVKELGFKGCMLHGLTDGVFHDDKRFWPIFERAEALDVPIYIHPSFPIPEVASIYYGEYLKSFPQVMRAAWGYAVETGTQAIRIILSGVLEKHPNVKIILGHMGETLPFMLWRINQALSRPGQEELSFGAQFRRHFYITTSGFFSTPALLCCMQEMGMDRIMFSVDYPFVLNAPAMDWVKSLQISDDDRTKFLSGNAKRLLRM